MRKVIKCALKTIVGAIFVPIIVVDVILLTIVVFIWTILIHHDVKEEKLYLDQLGHILELPEVWMQVVFTEIDKLCEK
jgi:hypothetical protein